MGSVNHIFANNAKVALILQTAHSENDIHITVGKCIKRSIIWNQFKVCQSCVSSETELSSCPLSIPTDRPSRREHMTRDGYR